MIPNTIHEEKSPVNNPPCNKTQGNEECEHNSIEDTASVASDLTRMYVSDEEKEVI